MVGKDEPDAMDRIHTFGTDEEVPVIVNDMLKDMLPIAPAEPGLETLTTLAILLKWRYDVEPSMLFMDYAYSTNSIRDMLKSLVNQGIVHENDWPFLKELRGEEPGEDVAQKLVNLNVVYTRLFPNVQQLKLCQKAGKPFLFVIEQELVLGVGYDDAKEEFLVCCAQSDDDKDTTFYMPYDHPSYQDSDFWFLE